MRGREDFRRDGNERAARNRRVAQGDQRFECDGAAVFEAGPGKAGGGFHSAKVTKPDEDKADEEDDED